MTNWVLEAGKEIRFICKQIGNAAGAELFRGFACADHTSCSLLRDTSQVFLLQSSHAGLTGQMGNITETTCWWFTRSPFPRVKREIRAIRQLVGHSQATGGVLGPHSTWRRGKWASFQRLEVYRENGSDCYIVRGWERKKNANASWIKDNAGCGFISCFGEAARSLGAWFESRDLRQTCQSRLASDSVSNPD